MPRPFPLPLQIGTDICHIPRILRILQGNKWQAFVKKVLREEERKRCGIREAVMQKQDVEIRVGIWRAEERGSMGRFGDGRNHGEVMRIGVGVHKREFVERRNILRNVETGDSLVGDGKSDGSTSASGILAELDGIINRNTEDLDIITNSDAHNPQPTTKPSNISPLEALFRNQIAADPDTSANMDTPKPQQPSEASHQSPTEISSRISAEAKEQNGKQSRLLSQSPRRRRMVLLREAAKQSHLAGITLAPDTLESMVREMAEKIVKEAVGKAIPSTPLSKSTKSSLSKTEEQTQPKAEDLSEGLPDDLRQELKNAHAALQRAAQFLAGRFAAKEATIKAHHHRRLTFQDISILKGSPNQSGSVAPTAVVLDEDREGDGQEVRLSISHDGDWAIATCLAVEDGWNVGEVEEGP